MKYDITISGSIGGWGVTGDYIRYCLQNFKGKRVDVAICSLGGYVTDGLDIYQQFKDHGDVHCHFVGMSASAATFLAMGAKEVDMVKNSLILIHNASQMVDLWASYNKESIDVLIEQLGKTRQELQTMDDLIAGIYADRCKKDLAVIQEQMTSNSWISSAKALELGLVDSVRTELDSDDKKQNTIYQNSIQPTNDMLTSLGLPALPEQSDRRPQSNEEDSLLVKVAKKLGIIKSETQSTNQATTSESTMLKIFNSVAGILNVEGFNINDEDLVTLDQQQMKAVDEALTAKDAEIKSLRDEIEALKAKEPTSLPEDVATINDLTEKLNKASEDLKAKDEQIKNLQNAPADETHDAPAAQAEEATGAAFTNLFK